MSNIRESIQQSIAVKQAILEDAGMISKIEQVVDICVKSLRAGGKIHFCGNGGSAADAQTISNAATSDLDQLKQEMAAQQQTASADRPMQQADQAPLE